MMLTNAAVKNAKSREKPYKLSDGHGLYLLVKPNGGKYWRFKYFYLGREKLLALGAYPEVSLEEAREKRLNARKAVAGGADPGKQRKDEKRRKAYNAENTFEVVAKEWFETNKPKWTPDHAERLWRRLKLHILSEIGDRPVGEISALDLLDALRKVEKRGATETSHRLLQTCNVIIRYAVLTGRIQYNPAQDLKGALVPHKAANHPTIEAKELPKFFEQLEAVETTGLNKLAIRILLLSFVRQGELRQAKWEDIDWKAKEWRLPAHTTKMRDAHIVPLAKQTINLLADLKRMTGEGELLFPSQQRRRHAMMSENTVNHVLRNMGYKGKLVGHGFRALASTTLNENGFAPDVIERQLAHAERNRIRAAYNRAQYLPERRKMMQWWADYLDRQAEKK
ncbi:MAG TPA: integrase arm-type DNA-binding domain-containing protein [Verrucomicrobiae bacterium]|jgi:integrase